MCGNENATVRTRTILSSHAHLKWKARKILYTGFARIFFSNPMLYYIFCIECIKMKASKNIHIF